MAVVGCGAMPPSMKMLVMISAIVVANGAALQWYAETIMRTKKMVWLADSRITRACKKHEQLRAETTAARYSY
ncbi:hypothetical protein NC652_037675 [Populus alba x Populus x berolinensis]|nr:hypothetical protein NC652_037675 [Populus alba x Populus x berolinensis]